MKVKKITYKMHVFKNIEIYQTVIRGDLEEVQEVLFDGKVSELHENHKELIDKKVSFVDVKGGKLILEVEE